MHPRNGPKDMSIDELLFRVDGQHRRFDWMVKSTEVVENNLAPEKIETFYTLLENKILQSKSWGTNGLRLLFDNWGGATPRFIQLCNTKVEQALVVYPGDQTIELILRLDELIGNDNRFDLPLLKLLEHFFQKRISRPGLILARRLSTKHPIRTRAAIQDAFLSYRVHSLYVVNALEIWLETFDDAPRLKKPLFSWRETVKQTSVLDTLSVNLKNGTSVANDLGRATFLQLAKRLQNQADDIAKLAEPAHDATVAIDLLATLQQQLTPCLLSYHELSKRSQDSIIAWILNNIRDQEFPLDQLKFAGAVCYDMAVAVVEYQRENYPGYFEKCGRPEISERTRQKLAHLALGQGRDGLCTYWHENGEKQSEGNYEDGNRNGLWIEWYENGQKEQDGNYKDGKEDGLWTYWHENGEKQSEGNYEDGNRNGFWTYWLENGQKKEERNYRDHKKVGDWSYWNENGETQFEGSKRSKTYWYENGEKQSEGYYKDREKSGLWIFWYENEQKRAEGYYKDGKEDGLWTYWHENGQKAQEGNYKDRKLNGLCTSWYENGKKQQEGNYKDGKADGLWTFWHKNEENKREQNYKDGKED